MLLIRRFEECDAAPCAGLIRSCLTEVNAPDYPEGLGEVLAQYTPAALVEMARCAHFFVALEGEQLAGCGAVCTHRTLPNTAWIQAVFTRPDLLGRGIGRAVMATLEEDPLAQGAKALHLNASLTAEGFYLRLGYEYTGDMRTVLAGRVVPMQKLRKGNRI